MSLMVAIGRRFDGNGVLATRFQRTSQRDPFVGQDKATPSRKRQTARRAKLPTIVADQRDLALVLNKSFLLEPAKVRLVQSQLF